ncbi:MAG: diaminopimelate decarboxylase [Bacteroidales bacterium]|nr:diaminopimelate decarboxylase [Bacteroidales bacterium]MDD4670172.1 diaminopimelate decarboxylase [Bacteroidales bacterium]
MINKDTVEVFKKVETPFYYYDVELLKSTLELYKSQIDKYGYNAHYALKANANDRILEIIKGYGLGADCVSGNEVKLAVKSGFSPDKIVYAGVGKSDKEIKAALNAGIFSFNCESVPEIKVINDLAAQMGKKARIALRINPDIDAHTHKYISTGRKEDKFGISPWAFVDVTDLIDQCGNVELIGLHFHVGSQITDMSVFELTCRRVEELQKWFIDRNINIANINLGGGLGVDYINPNEHPIAPFEDYFSIINKNLVVRPGQRIHFEPGRAIVAQCGHLISRVLYVKVGKQKKFAILDAGMNDLIRPALYQAYHDIENITSAGRKMRYDVVGPVCESSDRWGHNRMLSKTQRGDIISINTAGAYGQVMAMKYNQRDLAKAYYSDTIK